MVSRSWLARHCQLGLSGLILVGLIVGEGDNPTFAQVTADPSLGTQVIPQVTPDGTTLEIKGGTTVGDRNLFHSFSNFSVNSNEIVDFHNTSTINNILVRVTGGNPSNIQGILKARGNANLFLINPKGIAFGDNAELDIGGSFIGTTANQILFPNGGEFSMTSPVDPLNPLLTVNPSAFLFNQITAEPTGSIEVNEVRLSVEDSRSLLLVGGDVKLDGGRLRATSGRVELGGLAEAGTVRLNVDNNNLSLSYPEGVQRADVFLSNQAIVGAPDSAGSIQVQGRRVRLTDNSEIRIINTFGAEPGGTLSVTASESVELLGGSRLLTGTEGTGEDAGNLRIETGRLIVRDGAEVSASTRSQGRGGTLSVTAKESILDGIGSGLFVETRNTGNAGNIEIETGQLTVRNGAEISASTVPESTGQGGSITVKTGQFNVLSGAKVTVNSEGSGNAGLLTVNASSIKLDRGKLAGTTASGRGGDISLQVRDLILMRNSSAIATTAANNGTGGNITINASNGFIVAGRGENNDITADAFEGLGGQITIRVTDVFGIAPLSRQQLKRLRPDDLDPNQLPTNDITAISRQNPSLSGTIELNTPEIDPNSGLVNLPSVPVDTEIAQGCNSPNYAQSSFIVTGRGGLPSNPKDVLTPDAVALDWVTLNPNIDNRQSSSASTPTNSTPEPIVEATGWVFNAKGEVVFTADAPTSPRSSWQKSVECRT
ncbi:filamentous hemagglutinin N-terminal domain-containing protein [Scytonema sp. NUACC26]|uniref:filamentous hemagglutinin N-terminal domain-containing protein n=1 Tax=Scytonema sp. NUACC26 TaxID=3140176 RepID=UPI0034DB8762